MPLLATLLITQTKPAIDPKIAQEWTIAAATGLKSGILKLTRDGNFNFRFRPDGKPEETVKGIYNVGPMPDSKGKYKLIQLLYDLPSARKEGMNAATLKALTKSGQTHTLGMRLMFVPEVPLLTDSLSAHFVPVIGKAAALNRLKTWKFQ